MGNITIGSIDRQNKNIIWFSFSGSLFFFKKNIILNSKHRKKNAKCAIYYNNDKCLFVLVINMFVMFYSFFLQKAENSILK